jgi:hypothetical protein
MAPASTVFQDDYAKAIDTEHVHAANKRQTLTLAANYETEDLKEIVKTISTIDDIERNRLLLLLIKYEHLFDGTLRNFETSDVRFNLKDYAKPYHGKCFHVPKIHHDTLKHGIERLVALGVLKNCSDSEWESPRFISDLRKLNEQLKRKTYPIPKIAQMLQKLDMLAYAT